MPIIFRVLTMKVYFILFWEFNFSYKFLGLRRHADSLLNDAGLKESFDPSNTSSLTFSRVQSGAVIENSLSDTNG